MKLKFLLASVCLTTVLSATTCLALTQEMEVTPYILQHDPLFDVKAARGEDGLIHFTIQRALKEPKYLVAHLAVRHQGKVIATSDTPSFAVKGRNVFYLALAREDIAGSEYTLGEYAVSKEGVPCVGGEVYKFRLRDFVPTELR